jgi:RIO kinase 1
MSKNNNFDLIDQLEGLENIPPIRNVAGEELSQRRSQKNNTKKTTVDDISELVEQENGIVFSYCASKHEKEWLISSLADFYRQQWFDDVLRLIKGGGKEASVYQCVGNETTQSNYIAAKVYRPRKFRQLRNDSLYREGRLVLDDEGHEIHDGGALHAVRQRTKFGLRVMHTSWIEHEFQTLNLLHQAGADVPEPYASGNNAILMAYIGWDDLPAPTLNMVNLGIKEARQVFDRVIHNVEIMLSYNRVHGDLSAFNILYYDGEISLIDFPQSIDPDVNRNAYAIFIRDILRLCDYFQAQGLECNPRSLAEDLWTKHDYPIRQPVDPQLLSVEDLEND